jgi:hypothetical protein
LLGVVVERSDVLVVGNISINFVLFEEFDQVLLWAAYSKVECISKSINGMVRLLWFLLFILLHLI